jgi:hypothetical protein
VLVEDVVVNGGPRGAAITAIHIKSNPQYGGPVSRITYRNVCIGNVRYPIWLDTGYKKLSGGTKPSYTGIDIDNVSIFADAPGTGKIVFDGSGAERHLQVTLQDVLIDHPEVANSEQRRLDPRGQGQLPAARRGRQRQSRRLRAGQDVSAQRRLPGRARRAAAVQDLGRIGPARHFLDFAAPPRQ